MFSGPMRVCGASLPELRATFDGWLSSSQLIDLKAKEALRKPELIAENTTEAHE